MPIDIDRSYYNTGTATVSNGGTTVTGQGTLWLQSLRPGDIFGTHAGAGVRIASVDSNTQLTLAYPWKGPNQTAAPYEVQLTPYDSGYQPSVRELLQTMASGNLEALAALDGATDTVPYFTGPGAMALMDLSNLASGGQGWDAIVSTPAGLSNYNDRDPGFRVLVLDAGGRAAVYEKTAESWTDPIYFTGPKGDKGDKGDAGNNGWSPVLAMVSDGERRVLQVTDWTGGNGTKPATGRYLGPSGLVTNIAQAVNVRGPAGPGTGDMLASIYDPTGVAGDAFNMDNMVEGASHKILTAAERTDIAANTSARHTHSNKSVLDATDQAFTTALKNKLDGIEAGANVTNATTVGSAIHGSSAKATPVDADTVALIDSAASNTLKKVSWANIKATLKSYFDTLYAAVGHSHSNASTSAAGFMSATDKSKLDGIEVGAQVNAVTSVAGRTGAVTLSASDISGLGNAATRNVGTTSGTVAAGDDSRLVNAVQKGGTTSLGGYTSAGHNLGNLSGQSITPDPTQTSNFKYGTNNGAFTLNAPTVSGYYTIAILITNASSGAGAMTTSGFNKVHGSFSTAASKRQILTIEVFGSTKVLTIRDAN